MTCRERLVLTSMQIYDVLYEGERNNHAVADNC